jgi:hypothetical protein
MIKAHQILVGEPEGNTLGRPSKRWEDNIIRYYGVKMCNGFIWLRTEPSDIGYDPSGSINGRGEILVS